MKVKVKTRIIKTVTKDVWVEVELNNGADINNPADMDDATDLVHDAMDSYLYDNDATGITPIDENFTKCNVEWIFADHGVAEFKAV